MFVVQGRKCQAKGFAGPALGPKESTQQTREFTEEQLRQGASVVPLQYGTNQLQQTNAHNYGGVRQIIPQDK